VSKPSNPIIVSDKDYESVHKPTEIGFSLRDLFAAAALAGRAMTTELDDNHNQGIDYRWIAKHSYALADAMLAARDRGEDES